MSDPQDTQSRRIGDLTVSIDRDTCIGSGNCVKVAPEVFELDDTSTVAFCEQSSESPDREDVIEACDVCPVAALAVRDEQGHQLVP